MCVHVCVREFACVFVHVCGVRATTQQSIDGLSLFEHNFLCSCVRGRVVGRRLELTILSLVFEVGSSLVCGAWL